MTKIYRKRRVLLVALLLGWAIAFGAACSDQSDDTMTTDFSAHKGIESQDLETYSLWDNVFEVSGEVLEKVEIKSDGIIFPQTVWDALGHRNVGDILVSPQNSMHPAAPEGFWRKISEITVSQNHVIVHTEDARLEEVVKNGTFVIELNDDAVSSEGGLDSRSQGLFGLPPIDLSVGKSISINKDLTGLAALNAQEGGLKITMTEGRVELGAAIQLAVTIKDGVFVKESLLGSGNAVLDAVWDIEVSGSVNMQRAITVPNIGQPVSVSFAGRTFSIKPQFRVLYELKGSGTGKAQAGFYGSGHVAAGFTCESGKSCKASTQANVGVVPFKAISEQKILSGEPSVSLRAALDVSLDVSDFVPGAAKTSLTPLALSFNSSASVTPPFCPYMAALKVQQFVERGSARYVTNNKELFAVQGIASDIPECGLGQTAAVDACSGNSGCSNGKVCFDLTGICTDPAEMRVSLQWSATSVDLDLYVLTPMGEVISKTFPAGADNSKMISTASGGQACTNCGVCKGLATTNCQAAQPTGSTCPVGCDYVADGNTCAGGVFTCSDYDQTQCGQAPGCDWDALPMESFPYTESVAMPSIEDNDAYRIWVVNHSGSTSPVPYKIYFTGAKESFEIGGTIDKTAGARTLFFDYSVEKDYN